TFPLTAAQRSAGGGQVYWMEVIDPYVKGGVKPLPGATGNTSVGEKLSIYICPDYEVPAPDRDEAGNPRKDGAAVGKYPLTSYAPNIAITTAYWALGQSWAGPSAGPGTFGSIGEPAQIVMLAENHDCCVETWG